jgi:hypothetical protein
MSGDGMIVLDEVPGMVEALRAVQLVGGVLLDPRAAQQLVVAAWHAAEPAARAAAFADAADVLHEFADSSAGLGHYHDAATLLDLFSYEMRSQQ